MSLSAKPVLIRKKQKLGRTKRGRVYQLKLTSLMEESLSELDDEDENLLR